MPRLGDRARRRGRGEAAGHRRRRATADRRASHAVGTPCRDAGALLEREHAQVVEVGLEVFERREDEEEAVLGLARLRRVLPRDDELLLALAQVGAHRAAAHAKREYQSSTAALATALRSSFSESPSIASTLVSASVSSASFFSTSRHLGLLGHRGRRELLERRHHEVLVLLDDVRLRVRGDLLGLARHTQVLGREQVREVAQSSSIDVSMCVYTPSRSRIESMTETLRSICEVREHALQRRSHGAPGARC